MSKKIRISESQYNAICKQLNEGSEGEQFTAIPKDKKNFSSVAKNLASNPSTDDATVAVGTAKEIANDPTKISGLSESYIITKKDIKKSRERFLSENSTLFSYNDFITELKK